MRKRTIFIGVTLLVIIFFASIPYYRFLKQEVLISPLKTLFSLDSLKKIDNKVNMVLLGVPGGMHEGPNLSDSITYINYDFRRNRLTTIGIPRDLWSPTLRDRINSAYSYGEEKVRGGGLRLSKAEVGAVVGTPIQYGFVINFQEFEDLINFLGGVDVEIERSFIDKKFPIEGKEKADCGDDEEFKCRYETITFQKGKMHMDGDTALKFVRSRNAQGAEGSDFARSQRQQIVMSAIKNRAVKEVLSFNLKKIRELYRHLDELISRDMTNQQVAILIKNIVFKRKFIQKSYALPRELFEVPNANFYEGKYTLIPTRGDYQVVRKWIDCVLSAEDEKTCDKFVPEVN